MPSLPTPELATVSAGSATPTANTRISEAAADAAAHWLTHWMSGDMTDADQQAWAQWRAADPEHDRAWRHIEAVACKLKALGPGAAYQALSPLGKPKSLGRRKATRLLAWGGLAGVCAMLASQTRVWRETRADVHTQVGEQRSLALADGSRILLDTDSAVNVQFSSQERLLQLVSGKILVETVHALNPGQADPRPFIVQTAQGRVQALGTRFTVAQLDGVSRVDVIESRVRITPADNVNTPELLQAGERATFTRKRVAEPTALPPGALDWTRGQIIADQLALSDFLARLAQYRRGVVRCDPAIADLPVSGVFPLTDTTRILDSLPEVLPVQVHWHTRYWVTITAAA